MVTPTGHSFRSIGNGATAALGHALVRPDMSVVSASYLPEFMDRWRLDHCPLVVDVRR